MITIDFSSVSIKTRVQDGQPQVFDPIRKSWLVLTPEEHVRQMILQYLTEKMQYPKGLISVEKKIQTGNLSKRFDIVVYDRQHSPWMLIECKAPEVTITEKTLQQLLNYQRTMQCNYWVLTNGHQTFCADACDINHISWLNELPLFEDS